MQLRRDTGAVIETIISFLSTEGFAPHGYCLMWRPDVFWLHVVSDGVIALPYFSIPAAMLVFALRRPRFRSKGLLLMFAAFVLACGVTHLFGILTMWLPYYGAEALMKLATAIISAATAIALWPLIPKALRIPSVEELKDKVAARTRELKAANEALTIENEQRALAERDLIEARNEAETANRAKSTFLSVMSHELRTPLNSILGYAQLFQLENDRRPAERHHAYVGSIRKSGERLLALIEDVLDLSRIEVGRMPMAPVSLDVNVIAAEAVAELEPAAKDKRLKLTLQPALGAPHVLADPMRLRQVLSNLINNAIKYNDPGGTVTVDVRPLPDGHVELGVRDDGWGIPFERRSELFQPFSRLGRETGSADGAGIGLALSKRLIELMRGELRYEPGPIKGSAFVMRFPEVAAEGAPAPLTQDNQAFDGTGAGAIHILYIEDNPSNIELMRDVVDLVQPPPRMTVATTGAEGIERAIADRPNLILLDLGLPDMDGLGVLRKLQNELGAETPRVVAVTADATLATRGRAIGAGVDRFITKPFDVVEIAEVIRSAADGRAAPAN